MRSYRIRMLVLSVCAVLFASASVLNAKPHAAVAGKAVRLNKEFTLKQGQRVTLRGTSLWIKFVAVESDSRCPSDVKCVWAGNAAVQVEVNSGRGSKTLTLNTGRGGAFVSEADYKGYRLKLVDLNPYPRSDRQIPARAYAATLFVTKV
jgi:hypothetical protein